KITVADRPVSVVEQAHIFDEHHQQVRVGKLRAHRWSRYTANEAQLCATVQELCAKTLVDLAHVWQPGLDQALRSLGFEHNTEGFMSTDLTTYENLLAAITVADGTAVHDPATGEFIGNTAVSTAADVDAAVARATQAQVSWGALTHAERSAYLHKAADAVNASVEALAEVLAREAGTPLNGPNARFEAGACESWLRANADFVLEDEVLVDDDSGKAILSYVPIGVVGAIGPWNWPMMISVWQLAPSLRMGNTVVMKPSEHTPLSVQALVAVLNQVLPDNVLQVLPGDGEIGQAI